MKWLVVTAHPLPESLCRQLTDHVAGRLAAMGHDVLVEDLYRQGFEPALTAAERESYYSGSYDFSKVAQQAERLKQAEALALIFPTWWFGFPAILKGWFDRVWGPGIAYDHADDFGPIRPRLDNLCKTLVVTTLGAPWWVDFLVMRRPVRRTVKRALLGACARNSSLRFLSLYNSEKLTAHQVAGFKRQIDRALEKLA
jgi:putative NADPH-quinone reductase